MATRPELVCPAGTPAALAAAVEAGADAVYFGFRDRTNARNFPGLNFSREEAAEAIEHCQARGVRPLCAINTFPVADDDQPWREAIDWAARHDVFAVILADIGMIAYAAERHPDLRLHLSVQASAANPEAIAFYAETFGVKRVVLPRVLTVEQIRDLIAAVDTETEVFVFGGLCVMAEGRCTLSSWAAGRSPNKDGVCAPAEAVRYVQDGDTMVSRLGDFTLDRVAPGEPAGYPTPCKGRFRANGRVRHLFEDPVGLDATELVPALAAAGVAALKVEGRQRGPSYVAQVVRSLRRIVDRLEDGPTPGPGPTGSGTRHLLEGGEATTGAYRRAWR